MGYLAKGGKKDSLIFLQQAVNPVLLLLYAIYGKLKLSTGKILYKLLLFTKLNALAILPPKEGEKKR